MTTASRCAAADPQPNRTLARRSRRAHESVLDAAIEMFDEVGYQRLTIDGIAVRAGASKATIYRWWPSKGAILLEAFLTAVEPEVPFPDTGTAAEDFVEQLSRLARVLAETRRGKMLLSLLGEAQHDATLAAALREGWLEPRREAGRLVIRRAIQRGELRPDLDLELTLDGLYGPIYLRLLFGHGDLGRPVLRTLVDQQLRGLVVFAGDEGLGHT